MPQCGKCRYFIFVEDSSGECRFNPPVPIFSVVDDEESEFDYFTVFPRVMLRDWCSKFIINDLEFLANTFSKESEESK